MPAGFPKGQQRFTTAKVIVARVFAPKAKQGSERPRRLLRRRLEPRHARRRHRRRERRDDRGSGRRVSGVAPRAYLGNYKVFVETSAGLSPNANSPAIVAAIEAAVADGMNVINFSGGEPEIEPSRDIVALALDAAAAAGVVPVVAAGNDYNDLGAGSVSSPANSTRAIAVSAVAIGGNPTTRTHAEFSSVGPTTISHRLKPDVAAPGVDVLSSISGGGWAELSGTSMASPHVAGAAALLRQRHPSWSVDQLSSALVQSGADSAQSSAKAAGPRFQGGGVVALQRADRPLVFVQPTALSFGLLGRGRPVPARSPSCDAGGGAGTWEVARIVRGAPGGVRFAGPATVTVPGQLQVVVTVPRGARAGDLDAYVELRRGADVRRVPVWARVTSASLARHNAGTLARPGVYRSTTAGRPSVVSRYRYPETPRGIGVTTMLNGPERVFRFRIAKPLRTRASSSRSSARGSAVEPRIVAGVDENRLTGYAGLPVNHNPYMDEFRERVGAAAVLSPARGEYAVVFDSATRAGAGAFTFRYWVNDVTPPTVRLRARTSRAARHSPYPWSTPARASTPSRSASSSTARRPVRRSAAASSRSRREASAPACTDSVCARPTTRSRRTPKTSPRILPNTRWMTATFRVR